MKRLIRFCIIILLSLSTNHALAKAKPKVVREGETLSIEAFKDLKALQGKLNTKFKGVRLIDFWASWCGPCKQAMPKYESFLKSYGSKGFEVIGIAADADAKDAMDFLKTNKVSFPILFDKDGSLASRLGVTSLPTFYLVDRKGRVLRIHEGFNEKDVGDIESWVKKAVEEK